MATTDQFQKGMYLIIDDKLVVVTDRQLKTQGRQGGLVILSYRDVKSGVPAQKTVKSGTKYEYVEPDIMQMQYLYKGGESAFFMDTDTFESLTMSLAAIGSYVDFLKEGDMYSLMVYEDEIVSLRQNQTVELEVVRAPEAVKGNSTGSPTKTVQVETGYELQAPMFIKKGDIIVINTETGQYSGRKSS